MREESTIDSGQTIDFISYLGSVTEEFKENIAAVLENAKLHHMEHLCGACPMDSSVITLVKPTIVPSILEVVLGNFL